MICVFFFHNARFFDVFSDWHVKNATTNLGASILVAFMSQWIMPLFFLIAGASTYYAIGAKHAGQFVRERTLRLLVPLIFGMLVIVVPQAYFQALSHGEQLGGYNFFQLYWLYLTTLPDLNWFHLWFLVDLFIFSLITVPIFISWNASGRSIISRLSTAFNKPWLLLLLPILCLAAVDIFLFPDGFWGYRNGGWNIIAYLVFFISGYLIFANNRVMETVRKHGWIIAGIGIAVSIIMVTIFFNQVADPETYFGSPMFIVGHFIQALNTWCWLLAILALGSWLLNKNNRFLIYANEAVLPFYILHQTIIIVIGFYVVQWNAGIGIKYLVISVTSFTAIMLIYEFLVRRINVLRFLFGMRLNHTKERISPQEKLPSKLVN